MRSYLSTAIQYSEKKDQPLPQEGTSLKYDAVRLFLGDFVPDESASPSTKDYGQPQRPLPKLPFEIWDIIVDLATYVPRAYDVHDYAAFAVFTFDTGGLCARSRVESSIRDKLAIALVCKVLYAAVQPFLFELLRINSGKQALAVVKILTQRGDSRKKTRRIELALEKGHKWTDDHTVAMIYIFAMCPNLVCFSTASSYPGPWVCHLSNLIHFLGDHKNLKRVEVNASKQAMRSIEAFLQDLEVLWMLPGGQSPCISIQCFRLPQLRALSIADRYPSHEIWDLKVPNIRAYIATQNTPSVITRILLGNIEYLSGLDAREAISYLGILSNLKTLTVNYIELATQTITWSKDAGLPTLQCVLIEEVGSEAFQPAWTESLEENLERITSPDIFPNLRRVKIHLSFPKDHLAETEYKIRLQWLKSCVERGLRIEMLQGKMERSADG